MQCVSPSKLPDIFKVGHVYYSIVTFIKVWYLVLVLFIRFSGSGLFILQIIKEQSPSEGQARKILNRIFSKKKQSQKYLQKNLDKLQPFFKKIFHSS